MSIFRSTNSVYLPNDGLYIYVGNNNWFVPSATTNPKWPVYVSTQQLSSQTNDPTILNDIATMSPRQNSESLNWFQLMLLKLQASFEVADNTWWSSLKYFVLLILALIIVYLIKLFKK